MTWDRYGQDVLGQRKNTPSAPQVPQVPAAHDLVVEEVTTGWVGAVVGVEKSGGMHIVTLEDRQGRTRSFRLGPGFWVDGRPVTLVPPQTSARRPPQRTASGSTMLGAQRARVARPSRIWVEGRHDAELVERVWGADLRHEGIVVEMLDGVDHLHDRLNEFSPTTDSRVGVLVDHLVPRSKESRIAESVTQEWGQDAVLVLGHPYVDVWQAVRPQRLGLEAWPVIERGVEWKRGILAELGWPHNSQADVAAAWQRILGTVRSYTDLEPSLLGRVEELIDFVTVEPLEGR
ncbi:DUF3097 domain-containing protein [Jonesia quinghaiensis]|uniref:DUF3097 domain-containing protein n=1 Tax=Jonesia quinghaiensis TaxID=262806 RepID=UPI000490E2FD|nr:DUF3097 domain-containing protein [Jonesia quinghaiensis]